MSHAISNVLIELHGNPANVACYRTTFTRMKKDGVVFDSLTLARAIDRSESRDGAWRIAARRLVWEWKHDMERRETWGGGLVTEYPEILMRGKKKPRDQLYTGT